MKKLLIAIMSFCYILTTQADELIPNKHIVTLMHRYSALEKTLIEKDLLNIKDLVFRDKKPSYNKPKYIATAGSPGALKSTILETYMHDNPNLRHAVYVDKSLNSYITRKGHEEAFSCQEYIFLHHLIQLRTNDFHKIVRK